MIARLFAPRLGRPMRPRWAYTTVALAALVILTPTVLGLIGGDVFYALVEWPGTLALAAIAVNAGRRAWALVEFKIRRALLGWRQGPGTTRMLVIAARSQHPAWFVAGLASYPGLVLWSALRESHGLGWSWFSGTATAALLLLLSHWEYKAQREAGEAAVDLDRFRR